MVFRKKDEVKKKKQSEMAAKYPSANPRTDVTAVVTRKSAPEWAATSSRKAAPAVLRNVNEKPQPEKFPLNTVKNPTAEPAVLRDREYAVQAATGWKQYQTDESNRTRLAADRSYQKWQSRGGGADAIDVSYKPAKNWRVSENNTFGYLYAENKERAHSYAKSLNDLLSKQMDEIGDSLREGAQGQAQKIKDWGEKVWNTHTEAQQANAAAHEAQAEQVGQIGKQVLQKGKAAAEEAWKQQAEIQNRNSVQQIQRGKTQADAAMKAGENAMQQAGALALAQANVQKTLTDTITNVYTDFFSNPNWGKTVYETSGVTGSDQTGASIHGYRNDTRYKEPNNSWTDGERRLYDFHLKNNPKEADEYAIRVNNRYNQKKKDEKKQAIDDWTSQSAMHGAVAWSGARGLNLGAGIDGINQQLELAARGIVTVNPDLSASDIVETVDDTNADNLSEKYGVGAGIAYRVGTDVADAMISRGVNYMPVAKVSKDNIVRVHDVNEAIKAFNEGYLGVRNNDKGAHEGVLAGVANAGVGYGAGVVMEKPLKKFFGSNEIAKGIVEESAVSVVDNTVVAGSKKWFEQNQTEIERRKKNYMQEKGITGRKAWWMATKELIEQSMK